jgi:hypothetical protein
VRILFLVLEYYDQNIVNCHASGSCQKVHSLFYAYVYFDDIPVRVFMVLPVLRWDETGVSVMSVAQLMSYEHQSTSLSACYRVCICICVRCDVHESLRVLLCVSPSSYLRASSSLSVPFSCIVSLSV